MIVCGGAVVWLRNRVYLNENDQAAKTGARMLKVRTRLWKCSRDDGGTRSLAQLLCLAAVLVSSVHLLGASGDNRYDGK